MLHENALAVASEGGNDEVVGDGSVDGVVIGVAVVV